MQEAVQSMGENKNIKGSVEAFGTPRGDDEAVKIRGLWQTKDKQKTPREKKYKSEGHAVAMAIQISA